VTHYVTELTVTSTIANYSRHVGSRATVSQRVGHRSPAL